jgi:hypothetical protein
MCAKPRLPLLSPLLASSRRSLASASTGGDVHEADPVLPLPQLPAFGPRLQKSAKPADLRFLVRQRAMSRVPSSWELANHTHQAGHRGSHLGMDSNRIRTDTNSDVTIYHILFRIRIRIRILSNTNTKRIFRIRIHIRILTRFIAQSHNDYQFYLSMVS